MRMHRRPELYLAVIAAVAVLVTVHGGGQPTKPARLQTTWQGLVGDVHPEVSLGQRMIVVLKAPSLATRVDSIARRLIEDWLTHG